MTSMIHSMFKALFTSAALLSSSLVFAGGEVESSSFVLHGEEGFLIYNEDFGMHEAYYVSGLDEVKSHHQFADGGTITMHYPLGMIFEDIDKILLAVLEGGEDITFSTTEEFAKDDLVIKFNDNIEWVELLSGHGDVIVIEGNYVDHQLNVTLRSESKTDVVSISLD
ncbi:exported hypothetical protein [Vibrio chagasii]|nr:exported hypothetical protein [Vibrio chagasii]